MGEKLHRCPQWSDDAAERETKQFRDDLWRVILRACTELRGGLPDEASVESWHEEAFGSVAPLRYYAGSIRRHDDPSRPCLNCGVGVRNGGKGSHPRHARRHVRELFSGLAPEVAKLELTWDTATPAARAGVLAHVIGVAVGRFVQIHPFLNGNGRTSRVLWRALLARYGLPPQATVLRRPPAKPYQAHMDAAMHGNFAPFIRALLQVLRAGPPPALTPPT